MEKITIIKGKLAITSVILGILVKLFESFTRLLLEIMNLSTIIGCVIIMVITGLVFGIIGIKSEKKTFAIVGITLNSSYILFSLYSYILINISLSQWGIINIWLGKY